MPRWRPGNGPNEDQWAKIDKIRKSKRAGSAPATHDPFDIPEDKWELGKNSDNFAARVVEVHKRYAFVAVEPQIGQVNTKDIWLATIARRFLTQNRSERNFIVVGDRVLCQPSPTNATLDEDLPKCVILNMTPRHSKISRRDPMTPEREHVLAGNIDQLIIVASYLHPKVRWRLIDRYLVLAEEQEIPAAIILTKEDLLNSCENHKFIDKCRVQLENYRKIGYKVLSLSTLEAFRNESTIKELRNLLSGKISILSGHSGVGKSSLINLFKPEIIQEVEENPDIFYKGRHTTTYASFISLGTGGFVVDTPGIRSFILNEQNSINLSHYFVEFRPFKQKCKFRECRHIDEPGCEILTAVENELISQERYDSYVTILSGKSAREGRLSGKIDNHFDVGDDWED